MNYFLIGLIASMLVLGTGVQTQQSGPPTHHDPECTALTHSLEGNDAGCAGGWTEG